jgi:ribosome biogenesis GTPase A
MSTPDIHWYPGHIAKAERQLLEQLKRVDVILEVRDARIPFSTHHPKLKTWIGSKPRLLILNRVDMIHEQLPSVWRDWFKLRGEVPIFTNSQQGEGVSAVAKATQAAGAAMNDRRKSRGMLVRPVRAVVIGFPNVGKSALINRLVNRRVVDSARKAGVTRQLRWVRVSDDIELLDAPGVLPSRLDNQEAAVKLALCDDIGDAAYDNQRVASALIDMLKRIDDHPLSSKAEALLLSRYGLDWADRTGEDYIAELGDLRYQGDPERAARQMLNDFRKGNLGRIALELPPAIKEQPPVVPKELSKEIPSDPIDSDATDSASKDLSFTDSDSTDLEPTGWKPTDLDPTGLGPIDLDPTDLDAIELAPPDLQPADSIVSDPIALDSHP